MRPIIEHFQQTALNIIGDEALSRDMISESQHSTLFSEFLVEAKKTDPDRYGGVEYKMFRTAWDDPISFPSTTDMYAALYPDKAVMPEESSQGKAISRALAHFTAYQSDMSNTFRSQAERKAYRENELLTDAGKEAKQGKNIHPGSRTSRESSQIKKINDSELFPGTFYTGRTKIPARRWYAWWAVWRRRQTSIPPNQSSTILDLTGLGKRWEKHFVLGYALDSSTTYEVWYNTYNSSFSVHDKNGNPVADSVPTVRQAVQALFNITAKVSNTDFEYLNRVDASVNRVFDSTLRVKSAEADKNAKDEFEKEDKKEKRNIKQSVKDLAAKVKNSEAYRTWKANGFKDPEEDKATDYKNMATRSPGRAAAADAELQRKIKGGFATGYGEYAHDPFPAVDTGAQKKKTKPAKERPFNTGWSASINVSESTMIDLNEQFDLSGEELLDGGNNPLYAREATQRAQVAMNQADNSMTKMMLSQEIIGSVEQYHATKFNTRPSVFKRTLLSMFPYLRGRKANISTPVDFNSVIGVSKRAKGQMYGVDVRADFVTGFSLGSVDMEIWYVQELDLYDSSNLRKSFSVSKQRASFYVYDVKSRQMIQKHIPYYRLALQTVFLKLGAPVSDMNGDDEHNRREGARREEDKHRERRRRG